MRTWSNLSVLGWWSMILMVILIGYVLGWGRMGGGGSLGNANNGFDSLIHGNSLIP